MGSPNRMHSQLAHPSPTWWVDLSLIYTHRAYADEATPQLRKASDDLHRYESEWSILSEPLDSTRSLHIRRYCVSL